MAAPRCKRAQLTRRRIQTRRTWCSSLPEGRPSVERAPRAPGAQDRVRQASRQKSARAPSPARRKRQAPPGWRCDIYPQDKSTGLAPRHWRPPSNGSRPRIGSPQRLMKRHPPPPTGAPIPRLTKGGLREIEHPMTFLTPAISWGKTCAFLRQSAIRSNVRWSFVGDRRRPGVELTD